MWAFTITWCPSSVVCHPFTFHILIFSENPQSNELKLGSNHLWKVLSKVCTFCYDPFPNMALHRQFLFLIGQFFKNLLLWNRFAKLTETWQEASMECPLWRLLISFRSVNKHGHHRQFLFLNGRYLKNLLWNCLAKWNETWQEASTCMEGCVLSVLKAEWKVERHRLSPLAMFRLIWPSGFRGGDFLKLANQEQELPVEVHVW
jgi:hypothetical protein